MIVCFKWTFQPWRYCFYDIIGNFCLLIMDTFGHRLVGGFSGKNGLSLCSWVLSLLDGVVIDVNPWSWLGLTLTKNTSHWCQMVNERFLLIIRLHQDNNYTIGWLKSQVLGFGFPGLSMYPNSVKGFWRVKPLILCWRSRSLDSPRRDVSVDMWYAPWFLLVWEKIEFEIEDPVLWAKTPVVVTWHLLLRLSIYDIVDHRNLTMYKLTRRSKGSKPIIDFTLG